MASPVFEKLLKVLTLEREQGCKNYAVIGGLARFLQIWHHEADQESLTSEQRALVADILALLANYTERSCEDRMAAVDTVIGKLKGASRQAQEAPLNTTASQEPPSPPPVSGQEADSELDAAVSELPGISRIYARRLARLGVRTIRDLLYFFPRRYDDFSTLKTIKELKYGEEVTIVGTIWETHTRLTQRGQPMTQTILSDGTGVIQATWFNQPYLEKQLKAGRQIVISGRVEEFLGRLTFSSPEWEPLQKDLLHTGRLVPVYPLTEGIKQRWLRRVLKNTLDEWGAKLQDPLPTSLRLPLNLLDLATSIRQMHFPDNRQMLERARYRLCFEEFFLIQLGVLRQRHEWSQRPAQPLLVDYGLIDSLISALPFSLTGAQQRALQDILQDVQRDYPMSRLLEGDVGSGKTVVALLAMLVAIANGKQTAIMAPTEILAEQHFRNIEKMIASLADKVSGSEAQNVHDLLSRTQVRLLTSSVPRREKEIILQEIESGEANLVIGTHALIQEGVTFRDLALVVIDEQHRFGVNQRAKLRQKAHNPHMLVMSATPIPRTLALTIYGDLDLSIIDELPPHRQTVITRWLYPRERERAYAFVKSQVEKGHQAFIICPLIEESDKSEAKAAVSEYERLQEEVFPRLRLGLLHGRMKGAEKEATMAAFERGEYDILVSTSVVEVGIDVPNATVMLVEGANRFGLAQLHQFRGRVGRGPHQSYCLLLADSPTVEAEQRLKVIESVQDGFALAEEDLKMRGPGEFFGTRQSGLPDLKVAKLGDVQILEKARREAAELFARDPLLQDPEYRLLARRVERFWQPKGELS